MPERWLGVVVSGDKILFVDAKVPATGPLVLQSDQSWPLQKGDRAEAYNIMYGRLKDYIEGHGITRTIVKASAVNPRGGMGLANLHSAELRGVVMCGAASAGDVVSWSRAVTSRALAKKGKRKVDEYVQDDEFFDNNFVGDLRAGSREAALMLLAIRGE